MKEGLFFSPSCSSFLLLSFPRDRKVCLLSKNKKENTSRSVQSRSISHSDSGVKPNNHFLSWKVFQPLALDLIWFYYFSITAAPPCAASFTRANSKSRSFIHLRAIKMKHMIYCCCFFVFFPISCLIKSNTNNQPTATQTLHGKLPKGLGIEPATFFLQGVSESRHLFELREENKSHLTFLDEIFEDERRRDLSAVSRGFLSFTNAFYWNCKPFRSGATQRTSSLHKGHWVWGGQLISQWKPKGDIFPSRLSYVAFRRRCKSEHMCVSVFQIVEIR